MRSFIVLAIFGLVLSICVSQVRCDEKSKELADEDAIAGMAHELVDVFDEDNKNGDIIDNNDEAEEEEDTAEDIKTNIKDVLQGVKELEDEDKASAEVTQKKNATSTLGGIRTSMNTVLQSAVDQLKSGFESLANSLYGNRNWREQIRSNRPILFPQENDDENNLSSAEFDELDALDELEKLLNNYLADEDDEDEDELGDEDDEDEDEDDDDEDDYDEDDDDYDEDDDDYDEDEDDYDEDEDDYDEDEDEDEDDDVMTGDDYDEDELSDEIDFDEDEDETSGSGNDAADITTKTATTILLPNADSNKAGDAIEDELDETEISPKTDAAK